MFAELESGPGPGPADPQASAGAAKPGVEQSGDGGSAHRMDHHH